MRSVGDSWGVIEEWIARHAPKSAGLLGDPASDIPAAEDALEITFPDDLRASLRRHDGLRTWANILPGASPLPVAKIVETWRMCVEIDAEEDESRLNSSDESWASPTAKQGLVLTVVAPGKSKAVISLRPRT